MTHFDRTPSMLSRSAARQAAIALIVATATLALPCWAQPVASKPASFPPGLKWVKLEQVALRARPNDPRPAGNPQALALAKALWAGQYEPYLAKHPTSTVFFLVGRADGQRYQVTTALIDYALSASGGCEAPANGFKVVDMYSTCKVAIELLGQGKRLAAKFDNFCVLDLPPASKSAEEINHTEFALDEQAGAVYYRVIQYGKPVPACHRVITFA